MIRKSREVLEKKALLSFLKVIDPSYRFSKKGLPKDEVITLLKYVVVSKLKEKHLDLEHEFLKRTKGSKKLHSGALYIGHKISLLPSKIALFEVDFSRVEFKKLWTLIESIEKGLEEVHGAV